MIYAVTVKWFIPRLGERGLARLGGVLLPVRAAGGGCPRP
jgi:hypothetical protein